MLNYTILKFEMSHQLSLYIHLGLRGQILICLGSLSIYTHTPGFKGANLKWASLASGPIDTPRFKGAYLKWASFVSALYIYTTGFKGENRKWATLASGSIFTPGFKGTNLKWATLSSLYIYTLVLGGKIEFVSYLSRVSHGKETKRRKKQPYKEILFY